MQRKTTKHHRSWNFYVGKHYYVIQPLLPKKNILRTEDESTCNRYEWHLKVAISERDFEVKNAATHLIGSIGVVVVILRASLDLVGKFEVLFAVGFAQSDRHQYSVGLPRPFILLGRCIWTEPGSCLLFRTEEKKRNE